jgi:hypothetical protein
MRYVLELIPFLVFPFLLPGIPPGFRIIASIFLVISYLRWIPALSQQSIDRFYLSPLFMVIIAGSVLSYFAFFDIWYRSIYWPMILSGVFFLISINHIHFPILGLCITTISIWFSFFLILWFPSLFETIPFQDFISKIFPVPDLIPKFHKETGIRWGAAIIAPDNNLSIVFYHYALILTSSIFGILPCLASSNLSRKLLLSLATLWSCLIIIIYHQEGFLVIVFTTYGIILSHRILNANISIKRFFVHCLIIGFFYFGIIGKLAFFLDSISNILQVNSWVPSFFPAIQLGKLYELSPYNMQKIFSNDIVIFLILLVGLLLITVENLKKNRINYLLSFTLSSIAISLILSYAHYQTLLIFPFIWLGIGILQKEYNLDDNTDFDFSSSSIYIISSYCVPFILILLSITTLYLEKSATSKISTAIANQEDQNSQNELQKLFKSYPYRSDLLSVYVTQKIQSLSNIRQEPNDIQMGQIFYCLELCHRHNYIPVLAYKQLAELYLLKAKFNKTEEIYRLAIDRYPEFILFHGLRGMYFANKKQVKEAIYDFSICLNQDPTLAILYKRLSILFKSIGKEEESMKQENHAYMVDPFLLLPEIEH